MNNISHKEELLKKYEAIKKLNSEREKQQILDSKIKIYESQDEEFLMQQYQIHRTQVALDQIQQIKEGKAKEEIFKLKQQLYHDLNQESESAAERILKEKDARIKEASDTFYRNISQEVQERESAELKERESNKLENERLQEKYKEEEEMLKKEEEMRQAEKAAHDRMSYESLQADIALNKLLQMKEKELENYKIKQLNDAFKESVEKTQEQNDIWKKEQQQFSEMSQKEKTYNKHCEKIINQIYIESQKLHNDDLENKEKVSRSKIETLQTAVNRSIEEQITNNLQKKQHEHHQNITDSNTNHVIINSEVLKDKNIFTSIDEMKPPKAEISNREQAKLILQDRKDKADLEFERYKNSTKTQNMQYYAQLKDSVRDEVKSLF